MPAPPHVSASLIDGQDEWLDDTRFDVNDAVLILQLSSNGEKAAARDDEAVRLKDIGRDDDVGDAGFIFEGEKDEAFGGARALTGDDSSGDTDMGFSAAIFEVLC